jgi:cytochrome c-type biogenesis protein
MNELGLFHLLALPAALGLVGFVEPCSIGSSLLFLKFLEDRSAAEKVKHTVLFAATRAAFIGALGVAAVAVGGAFVSFQKSAWIALGILYALIGVLLLTGRARLVMMTIGPGISKLAAARGSAGMGVLFGLNIPACAAPLLAALLGAAAATGASGATMAGGFVSLGVFGFALSAPLVAAVFFEPARRAIDWLAHWAGRFPKWSGAVLILLGAWSIRFGLFAEVPLA